MFIYMTKVNINYNLIKLPYVKKIKKVGKGKYNKYKCRY